MSREVQGRAGVAYSSRGEWGYYERGCRVVVIAPRGPHYGQVGVVTRTYNDSGDMVHHVAFDGGTGDYFTEELMSASVGSRLTKQDAHKGD